MVEHLVVIDISLLQSLSLAELLLLSWKLRKVLRLSQNLALICRSCFLETHLARSSRFEFGAWSRRNVRPSQSASMALLFRSVRGSQNVAIVVSFMLVIVSMVSRMSSTRTAMFWRTLWDRRRVLTLMRRTLRYRMNSSVRVHFHYLCLVVDVKAVLTTRSQRIVLQIHL